MKVIVIGAAGHIGTYLVPMLVNAGYDTIAITRKMTPPYEDAPAWHIVKRELLDRVNTPDFIQKLKAMEPDIIVDLVNFNITDTQKIVDGFRHTNLSHYLYCSSCWAHGSSSFQMPYILSPTLFTCRMKPICPGTLMPCCCSLLPLQDC